MAGHINDDYFDFGPVDIRGDYAEQRGGFDGVLGAFDGISSIFNSVGRTVGVISDARADWAEGQIAADEPDFIRQRNEQELMLNNLETQRGDNVTKYMIVGAVAVAVIVLFK